MTVIMHYFPNHILKTASLSSTARVLLDVLVIGMRAEDNLVYFIDGGMEMYMDFYEAKLNKPISKKTIQNAVTELVRAGILTKTRNGQFIIDERMFFKWEMKGKKGNSAKWTNKSDIEIEESTSLTNKKESNEKESNEAN
jgi:hypothetical protein